MSENKVTSYQCPSCGHPVPVGSPMCPGCHRIFKQEDLGNYSVEIEKIKASKEIDQRERKSTGKIVIGCVVVLALIFGLVFFMASQESTKKKDLEAKLENTYQQVQTAILNEDYDLALLTVQNLRGDPDIDKDQKEKWDQIREETIKLIEKKQQTK